MERAPEVGTDSLVSGRHECKRKFGFMFRTSFNQDLRNGKNAELKMLMDTEKQRCEIQSGQNAWKFYLFYSKTA